MQGHLSNQPLIQVYNMRFNTFYIKNAMREQYSSTIHWSWTNIVVNSTGTLASRCPPLITTDQLERVYWCATSVLIQIFNKLDQHILCTMLYGVHRKKLPGQTSLYLPLISQRVSRHLGGHTLLIESSQLALIINFDELLAASSGERDVQLEKTGQGCSVVVLTCR